MATTRVTNFSQALAQLGVTEQLLSKEEKQQLDEKGFVIFPNLIDSEWLKQLQDTFDKLLKEEGDGAGTEVHQEKGAPRLSDLMNKGKVFDGTYTHPKVLAAVYYIIKGEFKVSAMNGRDVQQGYGLQALHEDWNDSFFTKEEAQHLKNNGAYREPSDPFHVAISLWMLDDFSEDNGATRVVPCTHRMKAPQFYLEDRKADHPDQVLITGVAGTVAVMNSHLWHGGTNNMNGQRRRVLHPYYVAKQFEQQQDQKKYIRKETYERISPAARYLLDVDS